MKFMAQGVMRSSPNFKARWKMEPLSFDTGVSGSCKVAVGAISANIGVIPIRLAIPFLKRRRMPLMGAIGPIQVKLNPLELQLEHLRLHFGGVLGEKGLQGEIDLQVACQTEMEVAGDIPIKLSSVCLNLEEAE